MSLGVPFLLATGCFLVGSVMSQTALDNGLLGEPQVDCMEDRLKLTFKMEKPFAGRIFVKGMIDNDNCVESFAKNKNSSVDYEIMNGQCNMRRQRKLSQDERGIEQSITIIVSFHDVFITKVDRAYRCTCFYHEADKVVTNRFDVSALPTTELIDTARVPQCTYSVRRNTINGPVINYATVGEEAFHVWQCDSDMFGMFVHDCFTDDGAGRDRKLLIDEHGCSTDPAIVPDLTYNSQTNLAYASVSVFKFADKTTTYFQCALTTCLISEGMCKGRTPPRCGAVNRHRRTIEDLPSVESNGTMRKSHWNGEMTMDLTAERIVVLDLEDSAPTEEPKTPNETERTTALKRISDINGNQHMDRICFSYVILILTISALSFTFIGSVGILAVILWRARRKPKF
ncbi:Zona pellucida-like domain protein [Aphelenchoides besseyi]|nr:Zona pellucida-like domain protein [Aphelenchoides besseyi]